MSSGNPSVIQRGAGAAQLVGRPASRQHEETGRLRILTLTSLFPSTARPRHGIFVETRLRHLLKDCPVEARVLAPVPWFPFHGRWCGSYAAFAATPRRDTLAGGLQVFYPRYVMLPKIGVAFQPDAMAYACIDDLEALHRVGWRPDLIDAHYLYPDGVAAAKIANSTGLPLVLTARGTDVNVLARQARAGQRVLWASRKAAAVIAVSTRLKEALIALGVEANKIRVVRNGVDTDVFTSTDRFTARTLLGLNQRTTLLCVGNLVPEKGFSLAIACVSRLSNAQLVIVGDGPLRGELERHGLALGVADRLVFMPSMPQAKLACVYSAADVLLLCSTREGWPNVVLESLACGTPVVATDVGAVNEILTDRNIGRVVPSRETASMVAAVEDLLTSARDRQRPTAHAARFDWHSVSQAQMTLFREILERRPGGSLDTVSPVDGLA